MWKGIKTVVITQFLTVPFAASLGNVYLRCRQDCQVNKFSGKIAVNENCMFTISRSPCEIEELFTEENLQKLITDVTPSFIIDDDYEYSSLKKEIASIRYSLYVSSAVCNCSFASYDNDYWKNFNKCAARPFYRNWQFQVCWQFLFHYVWQTV